MIYDLVVIGNGLAAQVFLHTLFTNVNKSQNYSVAQIFSEELAPACSLRSTASVSLSGIEEGISELGDELSKSFFYFEEFYRTHSPAGIESIEQYVAAFSERENEKNQRRYKHLDDLTHPFFIKSLRGKKLQSYIVSPEQLTQWFEDKLETFPLKRLRHFVQSVSKKTDDLNECHLLGGEKVFAKKILFCTGAYAKIHAQFFGMDKTLERTQVVAGSFLERSVDLNCDSFYFTLDGHNLIYRKSDHKLILGSVSTKGAVASADFLELAQLLEFFKTLLNLPLGEMSDFFVTTGLRHKGIKRRPFYQALDADNRLFLMSGLYKNGYSFPYYVAHEILKKIL